MNAMFWPWCWSLLFQVATLGFWHKLEGCWVGGCATSIFAMPVWWRDVLMQSAFTAMQLSYEHMCSVQLLWGSPHAKGRVSETVAAESDLMQIKKRELYYRLYTFATYYKLHDHTLSWQCWFRLNISKTCSNYLTHAVTVIGLTQVKCFRLLFMHNISRAAFCSFLSAESTTHSTFGPILCTNRHWFPLEIWCVCLIENDVQYWATPERTRFWSQQSRRFRIVLSIQSTYLILAIAMHTFIRTEMKISSYKELDTADSCDALCDPISYRGVEQMRTKHDSTTCLNARLALTLNSNFQVMRCMSKIYYSSTCKLNQLAQRTCRQKKKDVTSAGVYRHMSQQHQDTYAHVTHKSLGHYDVDCRVLRRRQMQWSVSFLLRVVNAIYLTTQKSGAETYSSDAVDSNFEHLQIVCQSRQNKIGKIAEIVSYKLTQISF